MAKMFYTLAEVCQKLNKSEDDVREMATSGQIQEFRDRDKLMFKVEQIDLLAGDEDTGEVHLDLEDTSGGSGLGLETSGGSALGLSSTGTGTGSGMGLTGGSGLADSREGTGISVFDTDHGGASSDSGADDTAAGFEEDLSLDAIGSGSGLLDLTRESDDTSLGAELLEEVYSADDNIEIPANASGLFEAAGADVGVDEVAATAGIAAMPMVMESYEGTWSGLGVGLMISTLIALVAAGLVVIVGLFGATSQFVTMYTGQFWIFTGGLAVVLVILAVVGMFIGKASE